MKYLVIFLLLCVNFVSILAQDERIETISVSVSGDNEVTIAWKPFSDATKINHYEIREYGLNNGSPGSIPSSAYQVDKTKISFTFTPKISNINNMAVSFVVDAADIIDPNTFIGLYLNISRTMYCSVQKYDSCNSTIILQWTQYRGWGSSKPFTGNVKHYQVYNANTQQPIGNPTTDTTYTVENVAPNTTNKFYVLATRADNETITSRSNVVTDNTPTPPVPPYIFAETASYNNTNQVDLSFQIGATTRPREYVLTRSANPNGPFAELKRFSNYADTLTTTDPSPLNVTGYYRLEAQSHCGEALKVSNLATAIVPKNIIPEQNSLSFTWDNYLEWPEGVAIYEVHRSFDGVNFEKINSVTEPKFSDNITSLMGKNFGSNIYYKINALASGSDDYEAYSKPISIDLGSEVYLPNAFTPDGNGQNDEYLPYFAFLPSTFNMIIYDRYGFKVFETTTVSEGWNGKLANNKPAPEGAYVFYISYTTGSGKKFEKKGNFSLIYP